jgi:hypothetical protein
VIVVTGAARRRASALVSRQQESFARALASGIALTIFVALALPLRCQEYFTRPRRLKPIGAAEKGAGKIERIASKRRLPVRHRFEIARNGDWP